MASDTPAATPATTYTYRCTKADGQLNGAGSTFIFPLLSKMGGDYSTKCGVKLNYQSIGSGGGIKQWQQNTVDFGASDAYLGDADIQAAAANGEPVEIPVTFGAVVVAYNLKGLTAPIKMDAAVIAGLFDGKITSWSDPAIAALNPGVTLPSTDVSVVHRSDGSGTTSIFTTYLTKASPDWVTVVGGGDATKSAGKTVDWPTGLGASGNEGVTQGINQTDGGVGYIELAYALQNHIPFADVQNKSGTFITPSLASLSAAADLPTYPADLRFNLADTAAPQGYPISGTTWIIVYKDLSKVLKSQDRANALVDFLWWAIHEGQADAAPLNYGSIPASLLTQDEAAVRSLNWAGQPLLP
jgi:phosphate transport system substrate-binding protein